MALTDLSFDFVVPQRKSGVSMHWDQLYPEIVKPGKTENLYGMQV